MRLLSLSRSCSFTDDQLEDFNVISEEIKQINKILENFLEFARPPRLKTKMKSPSEVVDSALNLLKQRLKSYQVSTTLVRKKILAETLIDPEQLKEVLVNIVINACEAMDGGGIIAIHENEQYVEPGKKWMSSPSPTMAPAFPKGLKKRCSIPFSPPRMHRHRTGSEHCI